MEKLTENELLAVKGGASETDLEKLRREAEEMLEELRKSPTNPRPPKTGSELVDSIQ